MVDSKIWTVVSSGRSELVEVVVIFALVLLAQGLVSKAAVYYFF